MWITACVVLLMVVSMNCAVVQVEDPTDEAKGNICCLPKKFEGYFGEFGHVSYKRHSIHFAEGSCMHYDSVNQQVAIHSHIISNYGKAEVRLILSFKAKKLYIVYGKKQDHCKVRPIKKAFRPACIPSDAKKVGSTFLGAGAAKLAITSYYIERKGVHVSATISPGCIPVSEIAYVNAPKKRLRVFADIGFYGITASIKDPKVFNVPKICKKAEAYPEVAEGNMQYKNDMDDLIQYFLDKYTV